MQGSDSNVLRVQVGQGQAVQVDLTPVVQPLEQALTSALSSINAAMPQPAGATTAGGRTATTAGSPPAAGKCSTFWTQQQSWLKHP